MSLICLFCADFTATITDLKCINIKCCIIYIYICMRVFQLFSSTFSNQNNLENGLHLFCWCFQLCCIFQVETSSSFQRPPLTSPVRSSWAQHGQNARLDGWHWDGDNRVAWVTHGFLVPRLYGCRYRADIDSYLCLLWERSDISVAHLLWEPLNNVNNQRKKYYGISWRWWRCSIWDNHLIGGITCETHNVVVWGGFYNHKTP